MLTAINVSYSIGRAALVRDVTLSVQAGEMLAVIGPNGAGKTTLLRLLSGDLRPKTGEVRINGRPLRQYKARELALQRAMMPQKTSISLDFTAYEVALMGRHPHIHSGETLEDHRVVREVLERTDSIQLRDQMYSTLSGGEQLRVTLARVLAQQTPILLLDEPTSALDLRHQQMTMRIARELADSGSTVVAVLHDLNLAAMYADRVAMMCKGCMVVIGSPKEALTAEHIEAVFEMPVEVMPHPSHDCPLVVPLSAQPQASLQNHAQRYEVYAPPESTLPVGQAEARTSLAGR
jgi:iron complex transport system ATP-binding protein